MSADPNEHVIEIEGLVNAIGSGQILHNNLNLRVRRDEVMTLVGG
jgi:ABC-type transporter Mla maintaining outer membrane lipid asymmetry ATPase subunit MlaF